MASKNYYEEIGVSPNATTEEITNAVRQIVKSNNPEHFTDAKDREAAQQLLKFIKQIYETLKDENLRWDYDIALFDESEDIDFGKIESINADNSQPIHTSSQNNNFKFISILIFITIVITAVTTFYLSHLDCNSQRNAFDNSICEKTQSFRSFFESDAKPVMVEKLDSAIVEKPIIEKLAPVIVEKPVVTEESIKELAPERIDTFQAKNVQNETAFIDNPSINNQCYDLWYKRNLIYANNGYCFESNLGKAVFKDFNCFTNSQNLSSSDKNKVDNIKSRENSLSCKIDTNGNYSAPHQNQRASTKRRS